MTFRIETFAATPTVGVKVAAAMEKAVQDCPELWRAFSSRVLQELAPLGILSPTGNGFGISVMTSESTFDYWATMGLKPDIPERVTPDGMSTFTIPAGICVGVATSLAHISEVYLKLYQQWPASQNEYMLDCAGISFELYPAGFSHEDTFFIYAPIKKARDCAAPA